MMVYVVPMLAAPGFFTSYVEVGESNITKRHDDYDDHDTQEDHDSDSPVVDYNSDLDGV